MTAGVAVENGVGIGAAGTEKDIIPEGAVEQPQQEQQTPASEPASWSVELSRQFLQHLQESLDNDVFRTRKAEAHSADANVEDLGKLFVEYISLMADTYKFNPGLPGVQAALVLVWSFREDEEVWQRAKAIEVDIVGVPQGVLFLMDWHEEHLEPTEVPELNVHRARDLVWKMIKKAESPENKRLLSLVSAIWKGNPDPDIHHWSLQPINYRFFIPIALEYGFHSPETGALRFTEVVMVKVFAALRAFTWDAEVNGLSWRLEKAWGLAHGTLLQVTMESTGGISWPRFNAEPYVLKNAWWEHFNVDAAYEQDAWCMVIPPEEPVTAPAPVILFMLGMGHFNGRQGFLIGDIPDFLQIIPLRKKAYVVVCKPETRTGLAYWLGTRFQKDYNPDCVWYMFTEVLRKLGPEKVDPGRLYVTGISQGGAGTWLMCLKYGQYFAAAMPCGGIVEWRDDTWPKGGEPDPECIKRVKMVPMRCLHVKQDTHAPPPDKDLDYLCKGLEKRTVQIKATGCDNIKKYDIDIHKWFWEEGGEEEGRSFMEYWALDGPLDDGRNKGEWRIDTHLIWIRAWINEYWGVHHFFLDNRCPEERQWKFTDPPCKPDTSKHKADLDYWGYFDEPEKDVNIIRDVNEDVDKLVEQFRRDLWKSVRYLREGQELQVSYELPQPREIEKLEFRAIKDRPLDKVAVMRLKPYVNTIFNLKMTAAEQWCGDISKFDTIGMGFRPPPAPGNPPPVEPLPLDTKLTEEHANLEYAEEKVPRQSPDAEEFTIWVLLKHHIDAQGDGYFCTAHTVKKGSMDVAAMKKALVPLLWEQRLIDSEDPSLFGLCKAAKSCAGPDNLIPGCLPLANYTIITVADHQVMEVCKPGMTIELIIDPVSGMKKDYSVEIGSTVWHLRFLLGDGVEAKAKRMAVGLPPKKKTDEPVPLEDDVVLTKAHAKLRLWTLVLKKAKS